MTTLQADADNYREADSVPDFRVFTIFFVVPGALLILIALWGLCGAVVARKAAHRHHPRPTPA